MANFHVVISAYRDGGVRPLVVALVVMHAPPQILLQTLCTISVIGAIDAPVGPLTEPVVPLVAVLTKVRSGGHMTSQRRGHTVVEQVVAAAANLFKSPAGTTCACETQGK